MRQTLTFNKEIEVNNKISSITSISLDHHEDITKEEINGEFIITGELKEHNDTTETIPFSYNLPYTCILPVDVINDTVKVEITDFKYNFKETILKVEIEYLITGDELERLEPIPILEPVIEEDPVIETIENEFIIYHIHIIKENEKLEEIIKEYNTTIDNIKEYNDINNIKIGDKLIIPELIND